MRSLLLVVMFVLGLLLAGDQVGFGQTSVPMQVHEAEIYRRGDCVQELGVIRAGDDELLAQALAPPEDDSDKWFISVVSDMDGSCIPCEKLKRDFETPPLSCWHRDAADGQKAWAFLAFYDAAELQKDPRVSKTAWRFADMKIKSVPTIIIQPPKNGTWGAASNVALRLEGYDGDAAKLSQKIRLGLKTYVAKMRTNQVQPVAPQGGAEQKITFPPEPDAPPKPVGATLDELLEALPEAPTAFLERMVEKKVSVKTAKLLWDREKPVAPAVSPPEPPKPSPPTPAPAPSVVTPTPTVPTPSSVNGPDTSSTPASGSTAYLWAGLGLLLLLQLGRLVMPLLTKLRDSLRAKAESPAVVSDALKAAIAAAITEKISGSKSVPSSAV